MVKVYQHQAIAYTHYKQHVKCLTNGFAVNCGLQSGGEIYIAQNL